MRSTCSCDCCVDSCDVTALCKLWRPSFTISCRGTVLRDPWRPSFSLCDCCVDSPVSVTHCSFNSVPFQVSCGRVLELLLRGVLHTVFTDALGQQRCLNQILVELWVGSLHDQFHVAFGRSFFRNGLDHLNSVLAQPVCDTYSPEFRKTRHCLLPFPSISMPEYAHWPPGLGAEEAIEPKAKLVCQPTPSLHSVSPYDNDERKIRDKKKCNVIWWMSVI